MKMSYKNVKPPKEFDERFGTKVAQDYEFPFHLTADEVWKIIKDNDDGYEYSFSEKLNNIIENINFPYIDMSTITQDQRLDILMGMASCINSDDIIWYINGNYGCSRASLEVEQEMRIVLSNFIVQNYVEWVISRKTWKKLKEQLSVLSE
jgi:hypothetical protein